MGDKVAICVEKHLDGWRGHANLYRLDPAIEYERWIWRRGKKKTLYVILSTVTVPFDDGIETLAFPAKKNGEPITFLEVGGIRGTSDHEKVLADMGYKLVV